MIWGYPPWLTKPGHGWQKAGRKLKAVSLLVNSFMDRFVDILTRRHKHVDIANGHSSTKKNGWSTENLLGPLKRYVTNTHGYFIMMLMLFHVDLTNHFPPSAASIVQILRVRPRHRWWPRLCEEFPGSTGSMFEGFYIFFLCHLWKFDSINSLNSYRNTLKSLKPILKLLEIYWDPTVIGWSNSNSVRIFYQASHSAFSDFGSMHQWTVKAIEHNFPKNSKLLTFSFSCKLSSRCSTWPKPLLGRSRL